MKRELPLVYTYTTSPPELEVDQFNLEPELEPFFLLVYKEESR